MLNHFDLWFRVGYWFWITLKNNFYICTPVLIKPIISKYCIRVGKMTYYFNIFNLHSGFPFNPPSIKLPGRIFKKKTSTEHQRIPRALGLHWLCCHHIIHEDIPGQIGKEAVSWLSWRHIRTIYWPHIVGRHRPHWDLSMASMRGLWAWFRVYETRERDADTKAKSWSFQVDFKVFEIEAWWWLMLWGGRSHANVRAEFYSYGRSHSVNQSTLRNFNVLKSRLTPAYPALLILSRRNTKHINRLRS